MAYSETVRQTAYVVKETTFGVVPAFGNNNAFRFINAALNPSYDNVERPDKTGSYSRTIPIPNNRSASGSMSCSLAGSGTAGTPPDIGPFLEAVLGKQTINAGTSVVYECDDVNPSLSIMLRDKPSSVDQLIGFGTIVPSARIQLGGPIPQIDFSLLSRWVLQKDLFAATETAGRGGLSSFPTEPSAPVTNGVPPRGRTGVITLDGQTYTTFRTGSIDINSGKSLSDPDWNSVYPGDPQSGFRTVGLSLEMYDDDSANLAALKGKALSKTPVDISLQIGAVAGNIFTALFKNIVLPMPQYGWGDTRRTLSFSGLQAAATSATSKDEFRLTLT